MAEIKNNINSHVSLLQCANMLFEEKKWEKAASLYIDLIRSNHPLSKIIIKNIAWIYKVANHKLLSKETLNNIMIAIGVNHEEKNYSLSNAFRYIFKVDCIYVINLQSEKERNIRFFREMNKHDINVKRIDAVSVTNPDVVRLFKLFSTTKIDYSSPFSKFITPIRLRKNQKNTNIAAFSYMLTKKNIFLDAIKNNYKRILVFDDDVFFVTNIEERLKEITIQVPENFKIMLLGASEYEDKDSEAFKKYRTNKSVFYHPIPDRTCGSFAVIYSYDVYADIIKSIETGQAPYDNAILGLEYYRHSRECYVMEPSICIPDVQSSSIKQNTGRNQFDHSIKMGWNSSRYNEFNAPYSVSVIVDDISSLDYIESFKNNFKFITIRIYYNSKDGLRPVISGHVFRSKDKKTLPIESITDYYALKTYMQELNVPYSNCILHWPSGAQVTEEKIVEIVSHAILIKNQNKVNSGKFLGVAYCFDCGKKCIPNKHSVIIPSYRGAKKAMNAVVSVFQQTISDFELIVVNDNPSYKYFKQELLDLCKNIFGKQWDIDLCKKLTVINHTINRNGAAARNTGLLLSSGEFISFLDDDDSYEPRRLEDIDSAIKILNPSEGAVYCGYCGKWHGNKDLSRFKSGDLLDDVLQLKYSSHYMHTNTVTYRRDVFEHLSGYNESYDRHQDIELMTRFFEKFTIISKPSFLVNIRPDKAIPTFKPSIEALCSLKHFYLHDMRKIICQKNKAQIEEILSSHVNDIVKRCKKIDDETVSMLKCMLRGAIGCN